MLSFVLILIATGLAGASGVPGAFAQRESSWGERLAVALLAGAGVLGLAGVALCLLTGANASLSLPLPIIGPSRALAIDTLSAFFLVPILLIGGLGAVYGLAYWPQARHPENGRKLRLFWGWLMAGMMLLVLARNALVFLFGWEVMALAAFMLISTEDESEDVRQAGWIYLVATHVGTLCLFAMFALLRQAGGSFDLKPLAAGQAHLALPGVIFCLALIGFGMKAGIMPLHFWLPAAHSNSPSHVSALMSGVMIKMGIYGLVRITSLFPQPPVAWGAILLILGAISGLLGVVFALAQHDLKRLLAYHSVENIGIIIMGLGLALLGRSMGRIDWVVLGLGGCLLHVWNHSLFKSLLFFSAGSVMHATGTRQIDQLGGLAKAMPRTALLFLIGALAICGLPPLNGFISELLIYVGLFRGVTTSAGLSCVGAALVAPVLAMIGALAVACFVKVYGAVFLGEARSSATDAAHEAPQRMLGPMAAIAACCVIIGLAPFAVAPVLDRAVAAWAPQSSGAEMKIAALVPLGMISLMGVVLLSLIASIAVLLANALRQRGVTRQGTWDCGYAAPTARMQYTASSFAQMLVGMFRWVLRPRIRRPHLQEIFPPVARFESHVDEVVLVGQILPLARAVERWLGRFHGLQQGLTQYYVLYILVAVVALLAWAMPIERLIAHLSGR